MSKTVRSFLLLLLSFSINSLETSSSRLSFCHQRCELLFHHDCWLLWEQTHSNQIFFIITIISRWVFSVLCLNKQNMLKCTHFIKAWRWFKFICRWTLGILSLFLARDRRVIWMTRSRQTLRRWMIGYGIRWYCGRCGRLSSEFRGWNCQWTAQSVERSMKYEWRCEEKMIWLKLDEFREINCNWW